MTRRHVAVTPVPELWVRAAGVTYRNLDVEDSGDPLPDWVFTRGAANAGTMMLHRVIEGGGWPKRDQAWLSLDRWSEWSSNESRPSSYSG